MSDREGTRFSQEIEVVLVSGKKDSRKMWNDRASMTEEVDENLFVVAGVVGVDLVVVEEEVSIDLERETTIDILKGTLVFIFSFLLLL